MSQVSLELTEVQAEYLKDVLSEIPNLTQKEYGIDVGDDIWVKLDDLGVGDYDCGAEEYFGLMAACTFAVDGVAKAVKGLKKRLKNVSKEFIVE